MFDFYSKYSQDGDLSGVDADFVTYLENLFHNEVSSFGSIIVIPSIEKVVRAFGLLNSPKGVFRHSETMYVQVVFDDYTIYDAEDRVLMVKNDEVSVLSFGGLIVEPNCGGIRSYTIADNEIMSIEVYNDMMRYGLGSMLKTMICILNDEYVPYYIKDICNNHATNLYNMDMGVCTLVREAFIGYELKMQRHIHKDVQCIIKDEYMYLDGTVYDISAIRPVGVLYIAFYDSVYNFYGVELTSTQFIILKDTNTLVCVNRVCQVVDIVTEPSVLRRFII